MVSLRSLSALLLVACSLSHVTVTAAAPSPRSSCSPPSATRPVRQHTAIPTAALCHSSQGHCIRTAALAPSGANHQPWHFSLIGDPAMKAAIRAAAEAEERKFYDNAQHDEWLKALEPIGTGPEKPHLQIALWLIVIFAERYGQFDDGTRYKIYYVTESVGIAAGYLISALHTAGLACLTHTPNPMGFLTKICRRPASNKPLMILAIGHPAADATIPAAAKIKKPLDQVMTVFD